MTHCIVRLFTAEAQRAQRVLFFLLSAETPESKNQQALSGLLGCHQCQAVLKKIVLVMALMQAFHLPPSQRQMKNYYLCDLCGLSAAGGEKKDTGINQ